ncbi:MAG: ABC-type transporter, integral rane subunit, partial [Firmicutes bacterium]|nr:ABC-type transporter, integral rane subunit [Bacillota bacterium]
MLAYIVKRLLQSIITMLGISVIIFALVNLIPGNPYASMIDLSMSPEQVDALLRQLGYYDPLTVKYVKWLGRMLQGDMGVSIFYKEPVAAIIMSRLGNTALLAVAAILIGSMIGIVTGIFTSRHR